MTEHANAALASYRIGGREYPSRKSARCRTCRSDHRSEIDGKLVRGEPHTAIVRALPVGCGLTPANIGEHYRRGHVAAEDEITRRLLSREAEAIGREVALHAEHVLMEREFAQRVIELVYAAIASGELQPDVSHALAAARLLAKRDPIVLERARLREHLAQAHDRLMRLFAVADDVLGEENWDRLSLALNDDPDLKLFQVLYVRAQEQRPRRRRARAS